MKRSVLDVGGSGDELDDRALAEHLVSPWLLVLWGCSPWLMTLGLFPWVVGTTLA